MIHDYYLLGKNKLVSWINNYLYLRGIVDQSNFMI